MINEFDLRIVEKILNKKPSTWLGLIFIFFTSQTNNFEKSSVQIF